MKYKAILFDLDFTIYDECSYLKETVLSSRIFNNPKSLLNIITYNFRIDSKNIIDDLLKYGNQLDQKNRDILFNTMKEVDANITCYEGVDKLLFDLKRNALLTTGLVTNGIVEIQKNKLKCLGIDKYFDLIIFTKEQGKEKPDQQPFKVAMEKTNIEPEFTLFVGDHPTNDIISSQELGMETMWIDHLNQNNIYSNYRISEPSKLAETIRCL